MAQVLAGVAPEVNLRKHVTCKPLPSANEAVHSGFETVQKSKTGYQWPNKKDLCPPKIYFKKFTGIFQCITNAHHNFPGFAHSKNKSHTHTRAQ